MKSLLVLLFLALSINSFSQTKYWGKKSASPKSISTSTNSSHSSATNSYDYDEELMAEARPGSLKIERTRGYFL